jgi:hypothetical protein
VRYETRNRRTRIDPARWTKQERTDGDQISGVPSSSKQIRNWEKETFGLVAHIHSNEQMKRGGGLIQRKQASELGFLAGRRRKRYPKEASKLGFLTERRRKHRGGSRLGSGDATPATPRQPLSQAGLKKRRKRRAATTRPGERRIRGSAGQKPSVPTRGGKAIGAALGWAFLQWIWAGPRLTCPWRCRSPHTSGAFFNCHHLYNRQL